MTTHYRFETIDAIRTQADESARELISQGWTERGAHYDLGSFLGDAEACAERIGRPLVQTERRTLETLIRERLDAAFRGDGD